MKEVFISYRRQDSYETQRLSEFLEKEFGEEKIFFDSSSIDPGMEWPETIKSSLDDAKILLVIIGDKWLHIQDIKSGRRRIDLANDWVRLEITTFLTRREKNHELQIIPVLLNNTEMPAKDFLNNEMSALCDFQAVRVNSTGHSTDFIRLKQVLIQHNISPIDIPPVITPMLQKPPEKLSKHQEDEFLSKHNQWKFQNNKKSGTDADFIRELYRMYEFESYERAWEFLEKIDELGIRPYNHHPRIQLTYNRVEIWSCTFNIGHKPTSRDLRLAKICEKIWRDMMK